MSDVLIGLLGLGAIFAALVVVPFLTMRWRLRRRNRVHPKVASPAPLNWLVSPAYPARLHRRLQVTVRVASVHTGRKVHADVAERAVELDRRIVLASRRPYGARSAALRSLTAEVDELDRLAMAVTRPLEPAAVGDPQERLTALADARAEVDALDHTIRWS